MNTDTIISPLQLSNIYQIEKEKLLNNAPYHLNIIDELHANENAHSRILVKILQYTEEKSHVNLISFLKFLNLDVKPIKPVITVEKNRIDACVMDQDYVIIIENKVNNAIDQEEQLKRYVDIVINKGYKIPQIYVLYLSRWGDKSPTDSSLPPELKEKLGDRYHEISFKQEVLPWLEKDVLPKCRFKDRELISAIEQYIDYLKGMFNQRYGFEDMTRELENLLRKELELTDDIKENDEVLALKLQELRECFDQVNAMRIDIRNGLRKDFLERLLKKLNVCDSDWTCVESVFNDMTIKDANSNNFGFRNTAYKLADSDLFFSVEIQGCKKFICGVFSEDPDIKEKLNEKFVERGVRMTYNNYWLYQDLSEYSFKENNFASDFYHDNWNTLFVDHMDEIVECYYQNIIKVFEAWKSICIDV